MARWLPPKSTVTFEDVPAGLTGQARAKWLSEHGLSVVDYFAWLRNQDPAAGKRPPARRRLLSPQARAELDARLERDEQQW